MSGEYVYKRDRALANPLADDDPRHGTVNGYVNRRCRCDDCRAAWAKECAGYRRARQARLEADPGSVTHGIASTYTNWSCRCGACTAAHTATTS